MQSPQKAQGSAAAGVTSGSDVEQWGQLRTGDHLKAVEMSDPKLTV